MKLLLILLMGLAGHTILWAVVYSYRKTDSEIKLFSKKWFVQLVGIQIALTLIIIQIIYTF